MIYGYIRVSTEDQEVENQRYEILKFADRRKLMIDEWVSETISTRKKLEDRELSQLMNKIKTGDTLICSEISRLARSMGEIVKIFEELMSKEVNVYIIKENLEYGQFGNSSDSTVGSVGRKVFFNLIGMFFGGMGEINRALTSQRTKEALAKRKSEGKPLGRRKGSLGKSKLDPERDRIIRYLKAEVSVDKIANLLLIEAKIKVHPNTVINYIKTRELNANLQISNK